mmetsp:Transcript_9004/g.33575  ORF Transcript_9004/g.33575 Transcript_9004/m.33575 type:complete len:263 (-) Transcript_9004:2028-2816(-)
MFTPGIGASSMWQFVQTRFRGAPIAPAPTADSLGSGASRSSWPLPLLFSRDPPALLLRSNPPVPPCDPLGTCRSRPAAAALPVAAARMVFPVLLETGTCLGAMVIRWRSRRSRRSRCCALAARAFSSASAAARSITQSSRAPPPAANSLLQSDVPLLLCERLGCVLSETSAKPKQFAAASSNGASAAPAPPPFAARIAADTASPPLEVSAAARRSAAVRGYGLFSAPATCFGAADQPPALSPNLCAATSASRTCLNSEYPVV